ALARRRRTGRRGELGPTDSRRARGNGLRARPLHAGSLQKDRQLRQRNQKRVNQEIALARKRALGVRGSNIRKCSCVLNTSTRICRGWSRPCFAISSAAIGSKIMNGSATRYPGAQPFSDDALSRKIFFGREPEVIALSDQILANRMVVVYARSGLGKTSLLNANNQHSNKRQKEPKISTNNGGPPEQQINLGSYSRFEQFSSPTSQITADCSQPTGKNYLRESNHAEQHQE